jgi:hypothetical protein
MTNHLPIEGDPMSGGWRKERGKDRWTTPDGWVIEGNDRDGYQSFTPEGHTKVFWGNSLASTKRLTDEARTDRSKNRGNS